MLMNILKRICAFSVAAVMAGTGAFAADTDSVCITKLSEAANAVITLNIGYLKGFDKGSTVYIVPAAELDAAKNGGLTNPVFLGEQDLTNDSAEYEFLMPENADSGVYAVVAGESDSAATDGRCRLFMYSTVADGDYAAASAKLAELNAAADFETALMSGAADAWYIDTDAAAWKKNKATVLSLMQSMKKGGFASTFSVEDAFLAAYDIADIQNCPVGKIVADVTYYDELECDITNEDFVKYPEQTAQKFKLLVSQNMPKTADGVKSAFRAACALACMSNTERISSIAALQSYNDIFQLDFTGDFTKVDSFELAKVFENNEYTSVEQVIKQFNDGIAKLIGNKGNNGNKGNTSGGSSGGGGRGTAMSNIYAGSGANLVGDINSIERIFPDVPMNYWAAENVRFVYENGIMTGDAEGSFRPDDSITREEWAKVVLSAFTIDTGDGECNFEDVDKSEWYYSFVAKAYMLGIVNGYDENRFGTGQTLTREDAVVMMYRMTQLARDIRAIQPADLTFTDAADISDYALEAVRMFTSAGVINGYESGEFIPQGNITRAEAAKIICSLLNELD